MDVLKSLAIDFSENLWVIVMRLLIAAICGFVVGYERKTRSKDAGIRTHTIVSMASALIMIISKYAFGDTAGGGVDGSRIAAQVVTGIGFLGAGLIFYRRDMLHGLTTAAGVWAIAGIGMAIGAGLVATGLICTVLIVALQLVFHLPIKALRGRHFLTIKLKAVVDDKDTVTKIKDIFEITRFLKFHADNLADGKICIETEFAAVKTYLAEDFYELLKQYPFISSIEKYEEI
ncbi:MAG: MgtC/SapB family protein [Clostridiales bacterium]|nr:MgtC/SapB family protein [Clostridiales bacterium]